VDRFGLAEFGDRHAEQSGACTAAQDLACNLVEPPIAWPRAAKDDSYERMEAWTPRILGIGGTTRPGSASARALYEALAAAERLGAHTDLLSASELEFPTYAPERGSIDEGAQQMLELVSKCDGLVISTPGFHGGPSGLIKNAIDYVEELREDSRPYLDGRAVGCIVCAAGWQATTTTLVTIRSTVHALRGWPTPLGVTINSAAAQPECPDPISAATPQLGLLAEQVIEFARWRHAALATPVPIGTSGGM
jgi:FMN reductase